MRRLEKNKFILNKKKYIFTISSTRKQLKIKENNSRPSEFFQTCLLFVNA